MKRNSSLSKGEISFYPTHKKAGLFLCAGMEYTKKTMRIFSYEQKPWGAMFTIADFGKFWIKIIRVAEGQATSLQTHEKRSELHVKFPAGPVRKYPKLCRHRMGAGIYFEFAWGACKEEDITRIEDKYGRANRIDFR